VTRKLKKGKGFDKGDDFVKEKIGSATSINLDGQWELRFYDDNTPAGNTPED